MIMLNFLNLAPVPGRRYADSRGTGELLKGFLEIRFSIKHAEAPG